MLDRFHGVFRALDRISLPTIARVEGPALGGGCELVLFCDWVFATPKAVFGFPEIALGVFPPAAAALLPRLAGSRVAADLVLTGRKVRAEEAAALGLIAKVSSTLGIDDDVEKVLDRLRAASVPALKAARKALREGPRLPFAEGLARTEAIYDTLAETPDMAEGLRAFLEKRPPAWRNEIV